MEPSPPLQQAGIGVVVPYDFALDRELWRWLPNDASLHLTRMPYAPMPATMEMAVHISDPELVAQGVTDLSAVSPLVNAYACASGSFVGGPPGEAELVAAMIGAGAPAALTTSGALLAALRRCLRAAPLRHLITPGGFRMSVAMSNCGHYGWVSDRTGYRYTATDPETGKPWPRMPAVYRSRNR